jgi:hypothetical protein
MEPSIYVSKYKKGVDMVFKKILNAIQVKKFESDVLEQISKIPLIEILKDELNKRNWSYEIYIYIAELDFKGYCSYLNIDIKNNFGKDICEMDESNCTLMLSEVLCFARNGCINGIDLTVDEDFLESLEQLILEVKKYEV